MSTRFPKLIEIGPKRWTKWVRPHMREHRLACCSCSLVHDWQFRVVDGRTEYRVRQAPRITAALRKRKRSKR